MLKRSDVMIFCILLCWLDSGCSNSKSQSNTSLSSGLQFVSPAASPVIDVGQSVTLTVNAPAIWSLKPGAGLDNSKTVGILSNTTSAATSVTYSVPKAVALFSPAQDLVVATDSSNSTSLATMVVVVNPALALSSQLTANQDCTYNLPLNGAISNNDGTVGAAYVLETGGGNALKVSATGTGTGPYAWSVASGSLPAGLTLQSSTNFSDCGSGSPSCAFLLGTPTAAGCSTFTVQVADSTGEMATSIPANIIITPPPLSPHLPLYSDSYQDIAYPPTAFSVSGGVPPYSWVVQQGAAPNVLPAGVSLTQLPTNSAAVYLSGTPATQVSALTAFTPALLISDSQTPYPAIATPSLNFGEWPALPAACTPAQGFPTSNSALNGSYAFLLRGFDASGNPSVIAGSFAADGAGNVTGGVEDVMRTTAAQADLALDPAQSSYTVFQQVAEAAQNGNFTTRGCAVLTAGGQTTTFVFSLGGCTTKVGNFGLCSPDQQGNPGVFTTGRLIEFDGGGQVSGIIRRQDTSAFSSALSGSYAFGLSGRDPSGGRFASAGAFTASSGAISALAADLNDAGTLESQQTGGSGAATGFDSNGRGTLALNVGDASFNLATYAVSAKDVLLATTGTASAANPVLSGEAIATAGPFGIASLNNSHMFHVAGLSSSGPDPSIGVLNFDGNGDYTGTQFEDQAGTLSTTPLSGTYTVDSSSGRFSLLQNQNSNVVIVHPLVGYAIPVPSTLTRANCVQPANCVTAFLVSTDTAAQAGLLEFQTPTTAPPPPFSNLYVSGYYFYGTDETLDPNAPVIAGTANALPNGAAYNGLFSASYPSTSTYCQLAPACTTLLPNVSLTIGGVYSVNSDGTASIGGETAAITNGNVIFYLDESPLNLHPAVMVAEQ